MTNLLAVITISIATNWTTTSIITEVVPDNERSFAIYRPTGYNETGIITSNTMATIMWNRKRETLIINSTQISTTNRVTWR